MIGDAEITQLKQQILASGLTVSQLVGAAWAAAASFRGSDKRGGANGGRIRLEPQRSWEANNPAELATVLSKLEEIQQASSTPVSIADLVVLGGCAAVEKAAADAGVTGHGAVHPGPRRRLPGADRRRVVRSPGAAADGFRNYLAEGNRLPAEYLLIDRANLLNLSAPEMTVLVGGLRVLGANHDGSSLGVLTAKPGVLTNDFFVNLLHLDTTWVPATRGLERVHRDGARTARAGRAAAPTSCSAPTRSCARSLRCTPQTTRKEQFVRDFVAAWDKVMNLDRFDLA